MSTIEAHFETRREAEMVVERLVQTRGIDRERIVIATVGSQNTVGEEAHGADEDPDHGDPEEAALNGQLSVTVTTESAEEDAEVKAAFAEFDGERA